jgi:DNA-directed RNA polymerase subunit beta'
MVENGEKIKAGKVLVKIPRRSSKSGDITGGLPKLLS